MIAMPNYTPPSGGSSDVVDDTSPQLGGNLDTNAHFIDIDDARGLSIVRYEYLIFQETTNAVNFVEITNAASGFDPRWPLMVRVLRPSNCRRWKWDSLKSQCIRMLFYFDRLWNKSTD